MVADLAQFVVADGLIDGSLVPSEKDSQGTSPVKQTPSRSQTRTGDGRNFEKITAAKPSLTHISPLYPRSLTCRQVIA